MAKKGAKRRKLKAIKEQEKQQQKEVINKKPRDHALDKMMFENQKQKDLCDVLTGHFLRDHYPKIINIVPKEERKKKGETFRKPGKLYGKEIRSITTKDVYAKRIKTMIKWHVINKGATALSEINKESLREFFQTIADNTGAEKGQYSKKTYDNYIDAAYKFAQATSRDPEKASVQLPGREYSKPIKEHQAILDRDFKESMRSKVGDYKREEYRRGSGYSKTQARAIERESEKHMSLEEQVAVALYVYGGLRNEEGIDITHDCIDVENKVIRLTTANTKHGRPRIVQGVDERFFDKYKQYVDETGDTEGRIFKNFHEDSVRDIVKECCTHAKIKYSGVHDLRKAYVEREEKNLHQAILKGEVTKDELIDRIMAAVESDPRLNPMVYKTEWRKKVSADGKTSYYPRQNKNEQEIKYSREKLSRMSIENLADQVISQQLGHNDPHTTGDYRSEKARENRNKFREKMKTKRTKEKKK